MTAAAVDPNRMPDSGGSGSRVTDLLGGLWRKAFRGNLHRLDGDVAWRMARRSVPDRRFTTILGGLGIATAIDLRRRHSSDGASGTIDFEGLGIGYENVHLRSSDLPLPENLQRLVRLFGEVKRPLLLYCKRGKDKTGFASTLYRLLINGDPIEVAYRQLAWIPFGHRKARHHGPWKFRALLERERPADLRIWIEERYPQIYAAGLARGEVQPISADGRNLPAS